MGETKRQKEEKSTTQRKKTNRMLRYWQTDGGWERLTDRRTKTEIERWTEGDNTSGTETETG